MLDPPHPKRHSHLPAIVNKVSETDSSLGKEKPAVSTSEAKSREERGDLRGAVREYQRALTQTNEPVEQTQILIQLGSCLLDTDLDEAEERIGQARLLSEPLQNPQLIAEVEILEGRLAQERGSHRLAHSKLTSAAERLREADGSTRLDLTILLASAERARGELSQALKRLESIDKLQLENNLNMLAEYQDELGSIYLAQGDFRAAVDVLTEALELDSRLPGHKYRSGRSRLLLAKAYLGRGDRVRSKRLIQEAMETFENAESGLSEAYALLGSWYEESSEFAQAARFYREGLNIDHDSDDDLGEARALRQLARVSRKRGDHDQATDYLEQARSLLAGSEDDVELAALMTEEAFLAIELSDYDRAVGRFLDALRRMEEDGEDRAIAVAKRNLANAVWESGDLIRAEQLLVEAKPVLEARGDLKELDELLDDLGEVLIERGRLPEAIESINQSLELDDQLDAKISRARSLLLLGRACLETGDHEKAGDSLKKALDIYEESGDDVGRSDVLFHLGESHAQEGRLREAVKAFRAALTLDSKHNDSVGIARAQRGLAGIYRRRGDLARAQEFIDDATAELTRITDPAEKALLWVEAGRLALDAGDYDSAERNLKSAAKAFDELGSPPRAATCRRLLALVMSARGKYPPALELLQAAKVIFENYGFKPELDQLYDDLALVYLQMSRLSDARSAVDQSLELGREMGWSRGKGRSLLILGQIEMRVGDLAAAARYMAEARSSYEEVDDDVGRSSAFELLGDLAIRQRDPDGAIKAYKEARRIEQIHGDTRGLARTFRKLGEVYYQRGDHQRAEEAFEQAEDHLRPSDDPRERGPLNLARGDLAVALGDHRTGIYYYERALTYFRDLQDNDKATQTYRHLAASHQALEQYEEAMSYMREMGLEQAALWASLLASLHPEISAVVTPRYVAGEHGDAVLAAFGKLEEAFRERTSDVDERSVSGRIRHWVTPEVRGLAPFVDPDGLRAFQNFCVSSFGILRNAAAHKWRDFNSVDSFAAVGVAHLIASLMDLPESTRPLVAGAQQEDGRHRVEQVRDED
jgi:tetratricopeptide (TPR) repeat protein